MKNKFIFFLLALHTIHGFAQKGDINYLQRAVEIQQHIWADTSAAFLATQIPSQYSNESAVVIASSYEMIAIATPLQLRRFPELESIRSQITLRQRVKINDKVALEEYSSIAYQKKLDLSYSYFFSKIKNKMATYIGAKVIKPDGMQTVVNTNEEVLTVDEKKIKEAKLAIPGLQVGDILDYYIRTEGIVEDPVLTFGPLTFFLTGEYPILNYSIRLQIDRKAGVKYVSANGAPSFKQSRNDDDDIVLELTQTNLPKYTASLFTSPFRQYPYIKLQCQSASRTYDIHTGFTSGEVKQGNHVQDIIKQLLKRIEGHVNVAKYEPVTLTQNYFGGPEKMQQKAKDSVVNVLFNAWRYYRVSTLLKDDRYSLSDIKYSTVSSFEQAVYFSRILTSLDIDNTIYLVSSRYSARLQNILHASELNALIRVKTDRYYWLAFDDLYTLCYEIPMRFQGEEAILLQPVKASGYVRYTTGLNKVPVTIPEYNSKLENLVVDFDLSNLNNLQISRTCMLTGAMRHDVQKKLLPTAAIEESLADMLGQKTELVERLRNDRKNQLSAAFALERNNLKTNFEEEISQSFDAEPKKLTAYEIIQPGLKHHNLPFAYKSAFAWENVMKKAGNNYILEIGKLIGAPQKIDEAQRIRNMDVYLPCTKKLDWSILINIPTGYQVKGVGDLNKLISNEAGSFRCTATSNDRTIDIKITRISAHNFVKASDWPKLLTLMDTLQEFASQKVLFEKM